MSSKRTIYMTDISPDFFDKVAEALGVSKWKVASMLLPHLSKHDAYRTIKRWHDQGYMPVAKRNQILNYENLCTGNEDINWDRLSDREIQMLTKCNGGGRAAKKR